MISLEGALAALLGLLVGSFLNVVIYRVPVGISVVRPRSSCPSCKSQIPWYQNVPIVSWLFLGGRCSNCSKKISLRYPIVEIATSALFGFTVWIYTLKNPNTWFSLSGIAEIGALLVFFSCGIALAIIDLEYFRLPRSINYFGVVCVFILFLVAAVGSSQWSKFGTAILSAMVLGLFYLLIHKTFPSGMGLGDVHLAIFLGLVMGWYGPEVVITGTFLAFLFGSLFGVGTILAKANSKKSRIAFGPWMVSGSWTALLIGPEIWRWYLDLSGIFG